jgi:hypothetical protein
MRILKTKKKNLFRLSSILKTFFFSKKNIKKTIFLKIKDHVFVVLPKRFHKATQLHSQELIFWGICKKFVFIIVDFQNNFGG